MTANERIQKRVSDHIYLAKWREFEQIRRANLRLVMTMLGKILDHLKGKSL